MKTWQKFAIIGALAVTASSTNAIAQDLYHAQEWSVDLFGTGTVGEHTLEHISGDRIRHDGSLGLGVGANYFFCKYFGIGVDAESESTEGDVVRNASLNFIGRLPIANTPLAPYAIVGGGREFEDWPQWEGHLGVGLEVRFVPHVSFFFDGRYVLAENSPNYAMGRAGFRFIF